MAHAELFLQRQERIESALLELMQIIPYQQITVTDLTKQLGISRKSFYYYYSSKESCFESLADRLIQESALYTFRQLTDNQDAVQIYEENLKFSLQYLWLRFVLLYHWQFNFSGQISPAHKKAD